MPVQLQNNTINRSTFKRTALAVLIGSMLSGCLDVGGGDSAVDPKDPNGDNPQSEQRVSITGIAVKGILAGAIVEAFDITGTTKLAEAVTDAKGKYTLPAFEHNGPVLVKLRTGPDTRATCDGAKGCDDGSGTGTKIPFGDTYDFNDVEFDLSAVLPSAAEASEQELMVTPITHMAAVRVQAAVVEATAAGEEFTGAQVEGLNRATATLLGLHGIDINKVAPVDITDATATNAGSDAAQLYGTLVASIQTIAEKDSNTTIADVINNLAEDYADTGGLVSNSDVVGTITLEDIFKEAIAVVAEAEKKAQAEGVEVDLDAAETQLDTEQAEAEGALPDDIAEAEPEVVIPDTSEEQAIQLGIDLLVDLNTWEDALTSEQNQTLSQPFIDQLEGTDAILANINDQTSLMHGIARLIGEEHEVEYCYYWDMNGTCQGYEADSQFEAGPVLKVVGVIGSLAQLASEIENSTTVINSPFDYSAQIATAGGISIEDLNDIISEEDAAGVSTVVYDLNATFTMTGDKVSSITFVMDSAEAAYPIDFNVTLTQADLEATSNKFTYAVSASSINLPDDNIVLSIPQGTTEEPKGIVSFTFATAADRIAFSANDTGEPSLAKLTAIDVHFESQGVLSGATTDAGVAIPVTTANLSVDFDYDYDAAAVEMPTTMSRLALGIVATNTDNEEINGEMVVMAKGDFSESQYEPTFFEQVINLKDAEAKFAGKVINTATDAAGTAQKAVFNGTIDANMSFFSPATTVSDEKQLVDTAFAKLKGSIFVSTTPTGGQESKVGFTGDAEVTLALVKNTAGEPFKLNNEEQYHVKKLKLFGRISADQDISMVTGENGEEIMVADRSASLAINAVVNADIAGLRYTQNSLPNNGDTIATLKYGIRSTDADHAVAFIDRTQAITEAIVALGAKGVDASFHSDPITNGSSSFARTNCATVSHGLFQLCDITSTENFVFTDWSSTPLTEAEALAQAQSRVDSYYNPFDQVPIPEPDTYLPIDGGNDAVIDHASCSVPVAGKLTDSCLAGRTYNTSATFPSDVTQELDRLNLLKGADAQLNDYRNRNIVATDCTVDAADAALQNCTITETTSDYQFFDPSLTLAEKTAELNNNNPDFVISNIFCEFDYCSFDKLKSGPVSVNAGLTPESIAVIERGKLSDSGNQYQINTCEGNTCDVALTSQHTVRFPSGLTNAERDAYLPKIEDGYIKRSSTLTLNSCTTHENGSMECSFNQVLTHLHIQFLNENERGLTKFIAAIAPIITNNGSSLRLNVWMDSQYGELALMTPYNSENLAFSGDIAAGETEEREVPLVLHYFDPQFDPEEFADGDNAFVQVSAKITINADLTGLDNARVSVFVNRIGEEDATGYIRLFHGSNMVELNLNSTELFTNGVANNFTIKNANAEMTLVLTCATDSNDMGIHDNDNIAACTDGINMQGDIFVGEFKVAELEDRNGLPVFNFANGDGYDLVITPNFIVQPSAQ